MCEIIYSDHLVQRFLPILNKKKIEKTLLSIFKYRFSYHSTVFHYLTYKEDAKKEPL